jgi:hypothetical protein
MHCCACVQLVRTMERRELLYSLDIAETAFEGDDYINLLLALLRSRLAVHVAFRGCNHACSPWLRQQAFMYLRMHLPGGCTDDSQVLAASRESDAKEANALTDRLLKEWIQPCRVRDSSLHSAPRRSASAMRAHCKMLLQQ